MTGLVKLQKSRVSCFLLFAGSHYDVVDSWSDDEDFFGTKTVKSKQSTSKPVNSIYCSHSVIVLDDDWDDDWSSTPKAASSTRSIKSSAPGILFTLSVIL